MAAEDVGIQAKANAFPSGKREAATPPRRRRMSPDDRKMVILREARAYFAEKGLGAGTTELARRIGITQPLLYRYFPTKDALIDSVYEGLLPRDLFPNWETLLDDDSMPVRDRLKTFYCDYFTSVLTYEHVRLFLFSGLSNTSFNARYYKMLSERIFRRIALALRREYGGVEGAATATADELEMVQSLHATIYHTAYRQWVHGERLDGDIRELLSKKIDFCLDGAERAFRWLPRGATPRKRKGRSSARLEGQAT